MKNLFLTLITSVVFSSLHAQSEDVTTCRKSIESFIPLYVIDNYCSKMGLDNILNKAKVDDRVLGIIGTENSFFSDSAYYVKYNLFVIKFDKFSNVPYLGNFTVFFQTELQMNTFASCYAKILGLSDVGYTGETNAVTMSTTRSTLIEGLPYTATCFVNQWDYCGKNKTTTGTTNSSSKSRPTTIETSKNIFMKSSEIVTDDYIKKKLLNSFYNEEELSYMHKDKNKYNIDYNSLQYFEYEKSFHYYFNGILGEKSHCIKYLITFTRTTDSGSYYMQYFLDKYFKVATSWATFDEKQKHINFWASFHKEDYNKPCE